MVAINKREQMMNNKNKHRDRDLPNLQRRLNIIQDYYLGV
jgi:hypothetical protein